MNTALNNPNLTSLNMCYLNYKKLTNAVPNDIPNNYGAWFLGNNNPPAFQGSN
jgi:hypothetical protein